MEKLILADGTEIEVQDGARLLAVVVEVKDYIELAALAGDLTKENLSSVKFLKDDTVNAEYTNLLLTLPHFQVMQKPGYLEVTFGLRERTQGEEEQEKVQTALTYLTDKQALTVKELCADWENDPVGYEYKVENPLDLRRNCNGRLWKLKKSHVKQADRYPGDDPTLWEQIVEGHEGTLEDPIPVPDSVTTSGFTYIYGKCYIEGETIYICKRSGVEKPEAMYGQEETLYFRPSALTGQYFEIVQ